LIKWLEKKSMSFGIFYDVEYIFVYKLFINQTHCGGGARLLLEGRD